MQNSVAPSVLGLGLVLAFLDVAAVAQIRGPDTIFAHDFEAGVLCDVWSAVQSFDVCDGIDNDCNDLIDEDDPGPVWFRDFDADGYEHMTGVRGRIETRLGLLEPAH